jgi:methylated-DNA-[protein]-cysteine S-methyltransferase
MGQGFVVDTPDGGFTIVAIDGAVIGAGWTGDPHDMEDTLTGIVRIFGYMHPRVRPGEFMLMGADEIGPHLAPDAPIEDIEIRWFEKVRGKGKCADVERVERVSSVDPALMRAARAVNAYYGGDTESVQRVPVRYEAADFRSQTWEALRALEPGRTITYSELAALAGRPKAVRPAASACAANPLPLFIPCHRVIRSDGSQGGFRDGLAVKQRLLARETWGERTSLGVPENLMTLVAAH